MSEAFDRLRKRIKKHTKISVGIHFSIITEIRSRNPRMSVNKVQDIAGEMMEKINPIIDKHFKKKN
jgi:hypothetical protein